MSEPGTRIMLRNAAVPRALLADPARFGGVPTGDLLAGDLLIDGGRVARLLPPGHRAGIAAEHDLGGRIVLPRLAEVHCHLDKCHTVARLGAVGGDLHAAIEAQARDKANWSAEDIRRRAERGLQEFERAGCGVVRTHVDWDSALAGRQVPIAWEVLGELAAEWRGRITLQRSALLPIDVFADEDVAARVVRQVAQSEGAVLGVFVFDQPHKRALLRTVFALAAANDLPLDFHVDEGLGAELDGLPTIAALMRETGFGLPVVCGHACSLANLAGDELRRTVDAVAAAGIGVVALPMTNLYLQDRQAGTPQRRGITRLRELSEAGVSVAVGSDNVGDAFCPLGAHDPLVSLAAAALAAHLDPPYGRWLPLVMSSARRVLGLAPLYVDQASTADLLVSEARHTAELVAGAGRGTLPNHV
jgi:cytosine/creatinine deaminase